MLNSQLTEEKRKQKEFEALLHENYEKNLSSREENSFLQRQLQEERNNRVQVLAKAKDEYDRELKEELSILHGENKILKEQKLKFEKNLQYIEEQYEGIKIKLNEKGKEVTVHDGNNKESTEKIRRYL